MIPYLDLKAVTALHGEEIAEATQRVVVSGWYLHGRETECFEREYADYIGTRHCIACGNGLDALTLILRAYKEMGVLHEGDEVLVPANTFIATILAITDNRLSPVLVEPREDTCQIDDTLIEEAITPRTRVLMLVHLYGCCACTERILDICRRHSLLLVEDNAQAHGCTFGASRTGSLGHAAAHSFYPGKNLGALGDAGAVTTDDDSLAQTIRALGNYGSSRKYVFDLVGRNSRMDELQAAVLRVKLRYLDADNRRRRQIAHRLIDNIRNAGITTPRAMTERDCVWHIFPIFCHDRDALQRHLLDSGIGTMIHYPIPPHRQRCYAGTAMSRLSLPATERIHAEELSLPCNPAMTDADVDCIIDAVERYRGLGL